MSLLRFDHFMEHALYHPQEGYYARKIKNVGAEGDFSTSASLSNSLAKAIADWLLKEIQFHACKKITVLEIGAGSGKLMLEVQAALPFFVRRKLNFAIVEKSVSLKQLQINMLKKRVTWYDSVSAALTASEGKALIFSNELVDAFPVRVFEKYSGGYNELYVNTSQRSEVFQTAEQLPESSFFSESHHVGERFEVHESFLHWQREWATHFQQGSILTVDYGSDVLTQLSTHPHGSLRGYLRHQVVRGSEIYQNVGHQDLTADVNFTDLQQWGSSLGIGSIGLSSQRDFLTDTSKAVDQFLRDAGGAGSAFQVLEQRKIHRT